MKATVLQRLASSWLPRQQAERPSAAWICSLGVATQARPQRQSTLSSVSTGSRTTSLIVHLLFDPYETVRPSVSLYQCAPWSERDALPLQRKRHAFGSESGSGSDPTQTPTVTLTLTSSSTRYRIWTRIHIQTRGPLFGITFIADFLLSGRKNLNFVCMQVIHSSGELSSRCVTESLLDKRFAYALRAYAKR